MPFIDRRARALTAAALAGALALAQAPHRGAAAETPPVNPGLKDLYQFGLLVKGPNWKRDPSPHGDSLQAAHLAHIKSMAATGKLLGAGPFLDDGTLRGVLIFKADSIGAARDLEAGDPAVASGRLKLELETWLGPVGVGVKYRERAAHAPDSMITLQLALVRRGPHFQSADLQEDMKLERGHRSHIASLAASGELVGWGAFQGGGDRRGVYIFDADSATARSKMMADPAVVAGRYAFEIHPWMTAWGVMP